MMSGRQPAVAADRRASVRRSALSGSEALIGIVFAAAGLWLLAASVMHLDWHDEAGLVSAGFVPGLCGLLLVVLGFAQLVSAVRSRRRGSPDGAVPDGGPATANGVPDDGGSAVAEARLGWVRIIGMLTALGLFALLFEVSGALAALLALTFFLMFVVQRQRLLLSIVYTVGLVASAWLLFDVVLRVPLPGGP